ncbi:MAG: HD-GYP domain-containing protein [Chloroflexota bacterium]
MNLTSKTTLRHTGMAFAILAVACLLILAVGAWSVSHVRAYPSAASAVGAAVLVTSLVLAYTFPIYVRHGTKLCLTSAPIFLLSALLPPALAGIAVMGGVFLGEMAVRSQRGSYLSDVAIHVGRWTILAIAASAVAHITTASAEGSLRDLGFLAAASILLLGDMFSVLLVLCPITGEHPIRALRTVVGEGGFPEAAQYVVGLIGVLLIQHQIWTLVFLPIPMTFVYLATRKEMEPETRRLLETMGDMADTRDPHGAEHSQRVAVLVAGIMDELGMHGQEAKQIITAARLHDIGKMHLDDALLLKRDALSPEERKIMGSVPKRATDMLSAYPDFSRGLEMVRHHLERWDGSGYPDGLAGTNIPFGARVIAVADAFDAMTSERSFRHALPANKAAQILRDGRNRQWDGAIVEAFLRSVATRLTSVSETPAGEAVASGSLPTAWRVPV